VFSAHREFIHYTTSMTTYQAPLRGRGGQVMSDTESSLPPPSPNPRLTLLLRILLLGYMQYAQPCNRLLTTALH